LIIRPPSKTLLRRAGPSLASEPMDLPLPQFIQFYPTLRCNQKCGFCFNLPPTYASDMSFDNALALLDILLCNGIGEIDIMGGEPLLLDWMPDFVDIAIKSGRSVNLSTNGSTVEVIEKLSDLDPEKFNIGISLEGSSKATHNRMTNSHHFYRALTSVSELVSSGLDPIVKTVVSKETMSDIQAVVDLLRDMGVKRYYLIHMDLITSDTTLKNAALGYSAFRDFYEEIKRNNQDIGIFKVAASCFEKETLPGGVRCAGGVRKLAVMPDGSVYPCSLFQHFEEFNLGNIFEDSLLTIWASAKLDLFRHYRQNRCTIDSCVDRHSCTGGCPAHGYYHYRKHLRPDVRCA
jgi:radical SAM protein with 4Fe4S-binding SPASM domain